MGTLTKVAVVQEQAVERKAKVRVMSSSLSRALIVELSIFKLVMILVVFCQMEVFAASEKQQCEVFYFTLTSLWPHFEAMSPRFRAAWSQWTKSYSDNIDDGAPRKGMDVLFTFASFHVYFCSKLLVVIFCTFAHFGYNEALQLSFWPFVCSLL